MRETPRIEGAGGNHVPTLGCSEVEVGIVSGPYRTTVVLFDRMERHNIIIEADFLPAHDCDLFLQHSPLLGNLKLSVFLNV